MLVDVAGERQKAWMFVMRLMYSGRDFAWLYPRQDQVAFVDGPVRAFEHFGFAASPRLRQSQAGGTRIVVGSERVLSARFLALATHYLVEPSFARPATGRDKGGVERHAKPRRRLERQ